MLLAKIKMYLILGGITLAFMGVTSAITAWKFYGLGKEKVYSEWDAAKAAAVENKLDKREKQDEIRNNRPDVKRVAERMRAQPNKF